MEMERLHTFEDSELLTKFDRAIRQNDLETLDLLCREGVEVADSANSEYGLNLYDKAIYYGNSGKNIAGLTFNLFSWGECGTSYFCSYKI